MRPKGRNTPGELVGNLVGNKLETRVVNKLRTSFQLPVVCLMVCGLNITTVLHLVIFTVMSSIFGTFGYAVLLQMSAFGSECHEKLN